MDYWERFKQPGGNVTCPWCSADLKVFTCGANAKPENKDRSFVNCSNKDGKAGCGLFCFLDAVPNDKFKPKAEKRAKPDGAIFGGTVANAPNMQEDQLARLQNDVTKLKGTLLEIKGALLALCMHNGIKFE